MKRLLLLLAFGLLAFSQLSAQSRTVTGKITDPKGNPLSGVSVAVKGAQQGTTSDGEGNFSIKVSRSTKILVITAVGFASKEISLGAENTLSIQLSIQGNNLDEVVVVAYGTIKKSENTSSSVQVNFDKFKNRPLTNVSSAIEGAAPGIQTLSANGQPGSAQSIRIRGFGSLNASNDPLIVVDGVPYSNGLFNVPYTGGLSNINMEDVESISVLKDAAATALYGSRGSNGVVIITTKKGKRNKNLLSFKMSQGFSSRAIPEYDRVNAFQYYPLEWQAYRNSLVYTSGQTMATANQNATNGIKNNLAYNPFNVADNDIVRTDGTLNPNAKLLWPDDLDWNKDLVRQGRRQEYDIAYSGGSDKSDFYSSFGYVKEQGYVIKSDFGNFTGRLNVNSQPVKWFKTGVNITGNITNSNTINDNNGLGGTAYANPFFFTRTMGPIYPVHAHNPATGALLLDATGQPFYDYGNMSSLGIPNRASNASPGRHVIAETKLNNSLFKRNVLSARGYADLIFTRDLKFTTNIAVDVTDNEINLYENNKIGDGAPAGRATKNTISSTSYTFNQLLTYSKSINKHNFSILAGHENYDFHYDYFYGQSQGQAVEGNTDLSNFSTVNSLTSYTDLYRIESYLSRANYDFDNKYFISGSLRRDANSRFKKDVRAANFWSVGLGWRMDKEKFLSSVTWVNLLKLRASYGRVGNDAVLNILSSGATTPNYYPYQALYALGYNNSGEPGIWQNALPDDALTWETAKSADVAAEFSLLKNRVSGTIEYYNRVTDGLIFGVQLPLSNGGYTVNKNVGSMTNKGIEIQLGGDIIRKQHFNWHMDVNWTKFTNRITKMPDGQKEIISGTKKLSVGHSIYDYWLRDWQGVDPSDGSGLYRANTYNAADSRVRKDGDTVSVNQNNARFAYEGSAIPDFHGSVSNTFSYRAFELTVLLTYQVGGKVYDDTYAQLMHPGLYGAALHKDALRAWQKAGDITDVPRMDNSKSGIFDAVSSRWLTDASFLNIRTVSLAYQLPMSLLSKINSSGARVFLSGENLQWFSARKGMNVQQFFTGVTSNAYTPTRTITVGLNVNF